MTNYFCFLNRFKKAFLPFIFLLIFTAFANAKVIPAGCFTDNMVLQQKTKATLWGKADAGKVMTIVTSWNNKKYKVAVGASGDWNVKVLTPAFGGPYSITFNDGEALTLNNILIGEVWVCSGQSNMEMQLTGFLGTVLNLQQEITDAANYPQIRMLKIDNNISMSLRMDVRTKGEWTVCSPQTVPNFSAVAYFYAKNLYNDKHIPIGIINSTWGGTVAEAWTSGEALKTMPDYAPVVREYENGLSQEQQDAKYKQTVEAWLEDINQKDPAYQSGKLLWAQQDYIDTAWSKMTLPTYWERNGLPNYDGTVWFRKKVNIPQSWVGHDAVLHIGGIDDYDATWFNGIPVGHTELFIYKRNYTIPASLLKAGDNEISIRVYDAGGLGGVNKAPMLLQSTADTSAKIDISGEWRYKPARDIIDLPGLPLAQNGPNRPTLIYNAMINPILPYTIKGVIWYQGESNISKAYQYRTLFPLLITDWRKHWGEGNFPFYFVQIANYLSTDKQPKDSQMAELREAQQKTLSLPNTGMAVTIDIGNGYNIHPQNKQEVGRRLSLIARSKIYGEDVTFSGPVYQSQTINGNHIELHFTNIDKGLVAKGDTLKGFAIAGDDKKFHWASAIITGDKVVVFSTDVPNPVAVRYAWGDNPVCNLYNGADLPASPFRTDDWTEITYGKK